MNRIYVLYLTSIVCGFCMMALEILGGRLLQPAFGSGIDVWAAIISVFILSLSVGYWIGGRLADRSRSNAPLGWVIILAAAFFFLLTVYTRPFIDALGQEVHTARGGVLFAALILFLPPSLLLGCVSPMLVKLVFLDADRVGRTTGTLYAVGSVGNVLGILATDYILLVSFQINHTILGMGTILAAFGLGHVLIRLEPRLARPVPEATADEGSGDAA